MSTNSSAARPAPAGSLCLVLPDFRSIDTLARRPEPFVLWPVGPRPLLSWWLDEAVRRNVATVQLVAHADPAAIRAFAAEAGYWSRRIEIVDSPTPGVPTETVSHLPGGPVRPTPESAPDLLHLWLDLQLDWLNAPLDPAAPTIDRMLASGIRVGPHARIHPSAQLQGPCWIGDSAVIESDCRIGPGACIGAGAVIDAGAEVCRSAVLPHTYVGRSLQLHEMIAVESTLLDVGRGVRVEITDRFLLAPLQQDERSTFARCAARWVSRAFGRQRPAAIA